MEERRRRRQGHRQGCPEHPYQAIGNRVAWVLIGVLAVRMQAGGRLNVQLHPGLEGSASGRFPSGMAAALRMQSRLVWNEKRDWNVRSPSSGNRIGHLGFAQDLAGPGFKREDQLAACGLVSVVHHHDGKLREPPVGSVRWKKLI